MYQVFGKISFSFQLPKKCLWKAEMVPEQKHLKIYFGISLNTWKLGLI